MAALDIGTRRIGVAVSDPLGVTAQPLGVVVRRGLERDAAAIKAVLEPFKPAVLLVGLPLAMDGTPGPAAEAARKLGLRLAGRLGLPVEFADERFSTAEAEKALIAADLSRAARREVIDAAAAALILQTFLDRTKPCGAAVTPEPGEAPRALRRGPGEE